MHSYKQYFNLSRNRYYSLGRQALYSIFQKRNSDSDSIVLLPSLICREVRNVFYELNLQVNYYDVDLNLRPINLNLNKNILAVVIVNYFGFPQEISTLKKDCKEYNVILIEDNCHGLFSSDGKDLLGMRGDFGIFSFRKTIRSFDGAFLACNNSKFIKSLQPQLRIKADLPSFAYIVKSLLYFIEKKLKFPLVLKIRLMIYYTIRTGFFSFPRNFEPYQKNFISPSGPNSKSMNLFRRLDFAKEVNRRRLLYKYFLAIISKYGAKPIFLDLPKGVVPYGYPFYANNSIDMNYLYRLAASKGLKLYQWPSLPEELERSCPEHYQKLWLVNFQD